MPVGIEQADEHPSGAGWPARRGRPAAPRRSCRARRRPRPGRRSCPCGWRAARGAQRIAARSAPVSHALPAARVGRHAQRVEPDLAGMVAALGGEQPRLQRQQRQRVRRRAPPPSPRRWPVSACSPRGQVDRQHRGRVMALMAAMASAIAPCGARDAPRPSSASMARSARLVGSAAAASGTPACCARGQRLARIVGQALRIAEQRGLTSTPARCRWRGRDQPVAAVVAGPAGDPDAPRMRRHGQRQARDGQAGALHQRVRRVLAPAPRLRCARGRLRRAAAPARRRAGCGSVGRGRARTWRIAALCGSHGRRSGVQPLRPEAAEVDGRLARCHQVGHARAPSRRTAPSRWSHGPG